jgi:hypothetical protein
MEGHEGAALPMLTDFPMCQGILDIGTSRGNAQFDLLTKVATGISTCYTVNNPLQLVVTEGPVEVTIEVSAIALPTPASAMRVARFAIEGQSFITGGTASTTPVWDVRAGYRFPHSGSPTGSEPIVFGAMLIEATDTGSATPLPALASVNIDCGVGSPTALVLNEPAVDVPVQATSVCGDSCACTASVVLAGGASVEAGESVQRLTVYAYNTNGLCGSNEMCLEADDSQPFCVADFGCSNGSVGMPCDHESQCDRAAGLICASSGFCADGAVGMACTETSDCATGLRCNANLCGIAI